MMITIDRRHYNAMQLQKFYWFEGRLYLTFVGQSAPEIITDPDGRYYEKLCDVCRVRAVSHDYNRERGNHAED